MKISSALFSFVLSALLLACSTADEKNAEANSTADTLGPAPAVTADQVADSTNKIMGVLYYSGLQPDEAKALGLKNYTYQLVSQAAYFLEAPDSLAAYLGQCLTLSGMVAEGWKEGPAQVGGQHTYNRKLFIVEGVQQQAFDECYYADTLSTQPQGRAVTYIGQVERMQRPAPDIAYDYLLLLQKPYRDANNPVQPGKLVRQLPLVAGKFEIYSTLEEAIEQKVPIRIRGVQHRGYAESEAVWVEAAGAPAL